MARRLPRTNANTWESHPDSRRLPRAKIGSGPSPAPVAELADAQGLGPCVRKDVWVQVPPGAPRVLLLAGLNSRLGLPTYKERGP